MNERMIFFRESAVVDRREQRGVGTVTTGAIRILTGWQADVPKRREWSIRQTTNWRGQSQSIVFIRLVEGALRHERAVSLASIQQSRIDVLAHEVETAITALAALAVEREAPGVQGKGVTGFGAAAARSGFPWCEACNCYHAPGRGACFIIQDI